MYPFHDPFGGYNIMFSLAPLFILFVFGSIIFSVFKNISVSMHNNKQPIVPVQAKVAAKRYEVSHHHHRTNNMNHHTSSTYYYVTFELTNNERMELQVPSYEFGMMVENDTGTLQFQGTRFISFTR